MFGQLGWHSSADDYNKHVFSSSWRRILFDAMGYIPWMAMGDKYFDDPKLMVVTEGIREEFGNADLSALKSRDNSVMIPPSGFQKPAGLLALPLAGNKAADQA